jgi:hypothetical protein
VRRVFVIARAERSNAETGVSTPPRSCLRQRGRRPWSGRSRAGAAGSASRATSSAGERLRAPAAAVLDASVLADHCPRDSTGQPALGALKAFMLLTEAPAGSFTRCPRNLNSHNHNQHAGRPCFSLAVAIGRLSTCFLAMNFSISLEHQEHRAKTNHLRAHPRRTGVSHLTPIHYDGRRHEIGFAFACVGRRHLHGPCSSSRSAPRAVRAHMLMSGSRGNTGIPARSQPPKRSRRRQDIVLPASALIHQTSLRLAAEPKPIFCRQPVCETALARALNTRRRAPSSCLLLCYLRVRRTPQTELATVKPHPMHDHRQLARHCDDRAFAAALRRDPPPML